MNERIKELAEQAGYHPDIYELCKPGMEKFAELIINSCCCMMLRMEEKYPANLTVKQIKKYYGVEE